MWLPTFSNIVAGSVFLPCSGPKSFCDVKHRSIGFSRVLHSQLLSELLKAGGSSWRGV